jgi:3'-phosphoadenosine 5'-phosphosulfate sulfotransferase (PAPS reductase)/FAD synthetase
MFRAANAGRSKAPFDTVAPICGWNKYDVLAYLKAQQIPIPEAQAGKNTTGIDLSTPSLLWMYDHHRDDFERICEVFPFAGAVVKRREGYGV